MSRLLPNHIRAVCRPLLAAALAAAAALAGGCANPRDMLLTGATGRPLAAWKTQAAPASEAVRPLTEGEGELVIATAIAVHEMRRP